MNYVGGFFNLLNPYALIGGLASVFVFTLHGGIYLLLKTEGPVRERTRPLVLKVWAVAVTFLLLFVVGTYMQTDMLERLGASPGIVPISGIVTLILARWMITTKRDGWAFVLTALTIVFSTVTIFLVLFPRVMVSSLNEVWSLTIYTASSSPYTLKLMSIVAACLVPVVLVYQSWTYWIFRKRITTESHLEY